MMTLKMLEVLLARVIAPAVEAATERALRRFAAQFEATRGPEQPGAESTAPWEEQENKQENASMDPISTTTNGDSYYDQVAHDMLMTLRRSTRPSPSEIPSVKSSPPKPSATSLTPTSKTSKQAA